MPRKPVNTPLDRLVEDLERNINTLVEMARSGVEAQRKLGELQRMFLQDAGQPIREDRPRRAAG